VKRLIDTDRPDLENLYRHADYVIDDDGIRLTIRLDSPNPDLRDLLRNKRIGTWAFITAYNPHSRPAPPEQNAARQTEMIRTIERYGHRYFHGYGTGEDWDPEPSLFVLDISREHALSLAASFRQHAILWGERDGEPQLLWC